MRYRTGRPILPQSDKSQKVLLLGNRWMDQGSSPRKLCKLEGAQWKLKWWPNSGLSKVQTVVVMKIFAGDYDVDQARTGPTCVPVPHRYLYLGQFTGKLGQMKKSIK